jgi:hypothetical protein
MLTNGIKVVFNAIWSIFQMPVIGMNVTGQPEHPSTLTGDVKFDLSIRKGEANERKE